MISTLTSNKRNPQGFYILPKVSISLRLFLIVLLILWGIILQSVNIIIGFIFVLSGILLTLLKPVTNNPKIKSMNPGKWVNVTDREFSRIREHYVMTKRWANSYFNPMTLKGNLFFFLLIAIGAGIAYFLSRYSVILVKIWALDCGAFMVLFFLTGERQPYHPRILLLKTDELTRLMEFMKKNPDPDILIQPMIEVKKIKQNSDIPTDVRLMLKFRSAPEEFMGLQIQLSINRVGSRNFPYLYTVFIGKKGFDFGQRIAYPQISHLIHDWKKKYAIEPKKTEEVDILVFRQATTRKSGYYTNHQKQREIVIDSIFFLQGIFSEANQNE